MMAFAANAMMNMVLAYLARIFSLMIRAAYRKISY
jgi:hypothetical protein